MHEYAVFLAGLDAFILDLDGHSDASPMSNMESTFLNGSALVTELLAEDGLGVMGRPSLGDKTSDYVVSLLALEINQDLMIWFQNGHHRRPSRHSFASTPRRSLHVPSRAGLRQKRPPSLVMNPLPAIPTVSSPILPELFLEHCTPESSAPDLSWGTSAATPSLPASPVTPGHPSFQLSRESTTARIHAPLEPPRRPIPPTPMSPLSPFSDVDTAEVLRIYDELQPSVSTPEPSPGPTTRRNHPYIPWDKSARERILPPPARSILTINTAVLEGPSRPPSRSGAVAPEPEEEEEGDFMEPGCWQRATTPMRWTGFAAVTRNVKRRLRFRKHRAPRTRASPVQTVPVSPPSTESPVYALNPPLTVPPRLRTRSSFHTPPTPSPRTMPNTTALLTPTSCITQDSPYAPSFASAGTITLHEWLAARRRASLEGSTITSAHMSFDEYERRGSWLAVNPEELAQLDEDDEGDEDILAERAELRKRLEAMRQGYACGFAGCTMHLQTCFLSPPSTAARRTMKCSPMDRHKLDRTSSDLCSHEGL